MTWRLLLPFMLLTACAVQSHAQLATWRDDAALWANAARVAPGSRRVQVNLAIALQGAYRHTLAALETIQR